MNESVLLKISLQRALLGEVTQNLIAVSAVIKDSKILIRAYFDERATESETDRISVVGSEVIADFPDFYEIEEQVIFASQDKIEEMEEIDFLVFLRAKS